MEVQHFSSTSSSAAAAFAWQYQDGLSSLGVAWSCNQVGGVGGQAEDCGLSRYDNDWGMWRVDTRLNTKSVTAFIYDINSKYDPSSDLDEY